MKKRIFNTLAFLSSTVTISVSPAMASQYFDEFYNFCRESTAMCVVSAPTHLPMITLMMITVGPLELSLRGKVNQAVAVAQEPAFMVLNNQTDANQNPLFTNAVSELKKENPQIRDVNDQEMAAIILKIGEQLY